MPGPRRCPPEAPKNKSDGTVLVLYVSFQLMHTGKTGRPAIAFSLKLLYNEKSSYRKRFRERPGWAYRPAARVPIREAWRRARWWGAGIVNGLRRNAVNWRSVSAVARIDPGG